MDSRLKIAGMTPSFAIEVLPATLPWPCFHYHLAYALDERFEGAAPRQVGMKYPVYHQRRARLMQAPPRMEGNDSSSGRVFIAYEARKQPARSRIYPRSSAMAESTVSGAIRSRQLKNLHFRPRHSAQFMPISGRTTFTARPRGSQRCCLT